VNNEEEPGRVSCDRLSKLVDGNFVVGVDVEVEQAERGSSLGGWRAPLASVDERGNIL